MINNAITQTFAAKMICIHNTCTQVPLQTVLGVTLAPKNGIYLKIISRTT